MNSHIADQSVDVIVDKGVMDVFMVHKSLSARKAWLSMTNKLAPPGHVISLSIHFKEWKRAVNSGDWLTAYSSFHCERGGSSTRPKAGSFRQPIALFVRTRLCAEWEAIQSLLKALAPSAGFHPPKRRKTDTKLRPQCRAILHMGNQELNFEDFKRITGNDLPSGASDW